MTPRCFYFGCWNEAGHFMHGPGSYADKERVSYYGDRVHLDGTLAPRRVREGSRSARRFSVRPIWTGTGSTREERQLIAHDSEEYPQGEFLRHTLNTGFTAIQWWDRTQGDQRGACNSTVLLEGAHDSAAMLAALATHFPHVLANLTKAGVTLHEVTVATGESSDAVVVIEGVVTRKEPK